ncbi:MAG: PAS domain S-box protein [Candidatus Acidiferrum sp.]
MPKATPISIDEDNLLELQAAALEVAANPIIISRRDGTIVWSNKAFEALTGYTEQESVGRNTRLLNSGRQSTSFFKNLWDTVLSGQKWRGELINKRKDGSLYHEEMTITPVKDENGEIKYFFAVKLDITERKRAELELQNSKEKLEIAVEVSKIGQWEFDLVRRTVSRTIRHDQIFGYQTLLPEWTPEKFYEHILPEDRAKVKEEFLAAIASGTLDSESRIRRADGEIRWIWSRGNPSLDETGKPVRMTGTIVDITERKQFAAQLHQEQKLKSVGLIAGGVAHHFNNMLCIILANIELLEERIPNDETSQKCFDRARNGIRSASAVTRQLLSFSQQQVLQPAVLDLNAIVQRLNTWDDSLVGENVELIVSLEPGLGLVQADPGQVQQMISNLVANAREAMPRGGRLIVKTANVILDDSFNEKHPGSPFGDYVQVSVTDNGIGMKKELIEHIFDPFFTTKEVGEGTGLGLATVYGFVKQNDGFILVNSEVGSGTTVDVYLPRVRPVEDQLAAVSFESRTGVHVDGQCPTSSFPPSGARLFMNFHDTKNSLPKNLG